MGSTMKLADRMRQSIRRRSGHVVLRAELAPLGGASQVSQALKTLQRDGELLRLGAGVYAKACRDESTHEVAHKLKAKVIDGGDGTQVLGHGAVQYVNDRNRRAFTAT